MGNKAIDKKMAEQKLKETQNNDKITNFDFSQSDFGLANMDSHLVTAEKIQEQSTLILINCMQSVLEIKKIV